MNTSPLSFDGMFPLFSSLPARVQSKFQQNHYRWDPEQGLVFFQIIDVRTIIIATYVQGEVFVYQYFKWAEVLAHTALRSFPIWIRCTVMQKIDNQNVDITLGAQGIRVIGRENIMKRDQTLTKYIAMTRILTRRRIHLYIWVNLLGWARGDFPALTRSLSVTEPIVKWHIDPIPTLKRMIYTHVEPVLPHGVLEPVEPEREDSDFSSSSDSSSSDGDSDEAIEEYANGPLAETGVRERP